VKRYKVDDFHTPFVFYLPGFNLRSTDLNAFLGLRQVEKLDWIIRRRQENHGLYKARLEGHLRFQRPPEGATVCSIHFGALAKDTDERRRVVKALVDNGIETRIFSAGNLGLHPFWYERYGKASFPVADLVHHCGLFLPNNPSLKTEDVEKIAKVVLDAL
jgi:CDP-4-dehydro-6-deoxyglucose reductase, E1